MNRSELKAQAKKQIKGNIGILFVIALVIAIISGIATAVLSLIPVVGSIAASIIITPAFMLSFVRVYLNLTAGTKPEVEHAFAGFDDFWSAFKVNFFVGLFTFLWSLLFVIPGIVKLYSYSMSMYILAENKGKPALDCISESEDMTEGHKMELFVLDLSFIGWVLLGTITFGIAFIWIDPYMQATYANAYRFLKSGASGTVYEEIPAVENPETEAPAEESSEN